MKTTSVLVSVVWLIAAAPAHADTVKPFSLPTFTGVDGQDGVYSTADHPDGIFVLEAFQNFCEVCNANAANVDALYNEYKDKSRVQVIDLDLDTQASDIQAWWDTYHPAYPMVLDDGSVFQQFGGDAGIPQTVVLDCKGNIISHTYGVWTDQTSKKITDAIDAQLAATCSAK